MLFAPKEKGQGLVEYAIILALVAITGLSDKPETVNSDPYGSAWMMKVEMDDPQELSSLMDGAAYEKYCAERTH